MAEIKAVRTTWSSWLVTMTATPGWAAPAGGACAACSCPARSCRAELPDAIRANKPKRATMKHSATNIGQNSPAGIPAPDPPNPTIRLTSQPVKPTIASAATHRVHAE